MVIGEDGCHPECLNGCNTDEGKIPTATSDSCFACKNYNFSGHCVPACPDGSYETPEKSCVLCSKKCVTCYGPLENQCLSCQAPKLFISSLTSCLKKCPRGWRSNKDGDTCVPCPPNCANCNSDDDCENCLRGFYLRTDTQGCVATCPDGQFKDETTMTCQFCHADCDTCTGSRQTQCAKCKKGSHYFHRKCSKEACPSGYFADLNISECAPCPKGCKSCLSPDSCEVCDKGWTLINGKYCVPILSTKCPHGDMYFNNRTGTCLECHPNCGTCFEGTSEGCLSCKHSTRERPALMHISSCLEENCPDQTFQYNNECRHCAHACKRCSSLQKCDICHSGYFLTSTGHCVPSCPMGQYGTNETHSNQCKPCPSTCLECVNLTTCSLCEEKTPFLTLDHTCVDRCPLGTFKNDDDHRCLMCHASCHSCSGPSHNDCLSCPPGTRLHDYTCQSCNLEHYYDTTTSTCQKCHESCHTCTGPLPSECMSCAKPTFHLDENKTCVPCCKSVNSNNNNDIGIENTIEDFETCCLCDEKEQTCFPREHVNGNKKRSSARELVNTSYLDAIVVFFTMLLFTFMAIVAYRKYKWSRRRVIRAKWRRSNSSNHQYEKLPTQNGCDEIELMQNDNKTMLEEEEDDSEDDDEIDISSHRFGDERRRLLMHNDRKCSPLTITT